MKFLYFLCVDNFQNHFAILDRVESGYKTLHETSITIYAPMIFTAPCVGNAFDAGSINYKGKWEGLGP
jgi:hypothetical protein